MQLSSVTTDCRTVNILHMYKCCLKKEKNQTSRFFTLSLHLILNQVKAFMLRAAALRSGQRSCRLVSSLTREGVRTTERITPSSSSSASGAGTNTGSDG